MRHTSSSDAKSRIGESDRPGRRPVNGRYRSIPQMWVSQYDWRRTGCRSIACGVRGVAPDHPSGANGPASAGMGIMVVGRGALPIVTGKVKPKIQPNLSTPGRREAGYGRCARFEIDTSPSRSRSRPFHTWDAGGPGLLVKVSSKPTSCQYFLPVM